MVLMIVGTAVSGWFLIFRTSTAVRWAQNNYKNNKLARWWPFSSMVLMPWYPTYLRCMGIFSWLFSALVLWLLAISVMQN